MFIMDVNVKFAKPKEDLLRRPCRMCPVCKKVGEIMHGRGGNSPYTD